MRFNVNQKIYSISQTPIIRLTPQLSFQIELKIKAWYFGCNRLTNFGPKDCHKSAQRSQRFVIVRQWDVIATFYVITTLRMRLNVHGLVGNGVIVRTVQVFRE